MSDVYLRENEMKTMKLYFGAFLTLTTAALIFQNNGTLWYGTQIKKRWKSLNLFYDVVIQKFNNLDTLCGQT